MVETDEFGDVQTHVADPIVMAHALQSLETGRGVVARQHEKVTVYRSLAGCSLHNLGSRQQAAAGPRWRGGSARIESANELSCSERATMCTGYVRKRADFIDTHVASTVDQFASLRRGKSRDVRGGFHIVEAHAARITFLGRRVLDFSMAASPLISIGSLMRVMVYNRNLGSNSSRLPLLRHCATAPLRHYATAPPAPQRQRRSLPLARWLRQPPDVEQQCSCQLCVPIKVRALGTGSIPSPNGTHRYCFSPAVGLHERQRLDGHQRNYRRTPPRPGAASSRPRRAAHPRQKVFRGARQPGPR